CAHPGGAARARRRAPVARPGSRPRSRPHRPAPAPDARIPVALARRAAPRLSLHKDPHMSDMRLNGLAFDRGIDSISYAGRETTGQQLPERHELSPSSDGVRAQLSQLLDKPNTERFLNEALKPAVENRDLLMPGRFSQA